MGGLKRHKNSLFSLKETNHWLNRCTSRRIFMVIEATGSVRKPIVSFQLLRWDYQVLALPWSHIPLGHAWKTSFIGARTTFAKSVQWEGVATLSSSWITAVSSHPSEEAHFSWWYRQRLNHHHHYCIQGTNLSIYLLLHLGPDDTLTFLLLFHPIIAHEQDSQIL